MDKKRLREFRVALVEADQALQLDNPFYVPGLHGTDEEDMITALMDDILARGVTGSHLFCFTGHRQKHRVAQAGAVAASREHPGHSF